MYAKPPHHARSPNYARRVLTRTSSPVALQDALLACFRLAPRLPNNAIIRDMERRLLGENPTLLALVTRACHQQGLLQVFEDYCSHDDGDCQGCHFPLSHVSCVRLA